MTNLTLGISLAIFSNIFTGLSYTASKAAHNRVSASQSIAITQHSDEEDSESLEEVPPTPTQLLPLQQPSIFLVLRQSTWWLGILLLATGQAANFIAYGNAPTSTIAPLGSLSILAGMLSGYIFLKEPISRNVLYGMFCTVLGAASVVYFSPIVNPRSLTPEEIMKLVQNAGFISYLVCTATCLGILALLDNRGLGRKYLFVRIGMTSICGGYTILCTKSLSSMMSAGLPSKVIFSYGISWVLLITLITFSLAVVFSTNRALSAFDSTRVLPAEFATHAMFAIAGSAILYNEFIFTSVLHLICFFCGLSLTFVGVFLIGSPGAQGQISLPDRDSPEVRRSPIQFTQAAPTAPNILRRVWGSRDLEKGVRIEPPIEVPSEASGSIEMIVSPTTETAIGSGRQRRSIG